MPDDEVVSPPGDPYVELTDAAAHAAAVRARAERRERHDRATEVATWLGTLRDLTERAATVVLSTRDARTLRGWLMGLSSDQLVLGLPGGGRIHLRLAALRMVRPEPGSVAPPASGDRLAPVDATIEDVIDGLAEEGGSVVLHVRDLADPLRGEVRAIGEDVVTLRLTGPGRAVVYVPVGAVDAVALE